MNKEQKIAVVESLKEKFANSQFFYLADSSELTVAEINDLRALCYERGVSLTVVKNTLVRKAFEAIGDQYAELYPVLNGPTSVMFSEIGNVPAKVIQEFRTKKEKPILKAAWIDSGIYIGDEQLTNLVNLKSKEDLIGELIGLLQSPAKNVVGALQSGGGKLAGILKTLSEKAEA
ncbi:MAG: 50S ribosomal protein L10 [Bacteroidetes bacterium]|nr:50S ribosomal protein L10 [Bacteroidota bacterium]